MLNALAGARLLTLVFTDLVASTRLKSEQGDHIAAGLIARHRSQVNRLREKSDGRVVDWAGDGCFLTFEVPSAAVVFAIRLQQVHAQDSGLPKVRVGIHMGEVTESHTLEGMLRVEGLAVDLTARIQSLALPGQVLMSSAVFNSARQRLGSAEVGEPIAWRAHGSYYPHGFEDAIEICEAGLEGVSPLAAPPDSGKVRRAVAPGEEETLGWRPAVGLAVAGHDHWRLQRQLGEGGFGEVWLAVHEKTREKRVFKFCFELERVRGLKREVVLFRLLKEALGTRDDIARVLDWQFERPPYFLEAEYTEGGDLKAWAEARGGLEAVPMNVRLSILAQVAEALGAAHSVGVLHKDIKPENILIVEDRGPCPGIRLTDFGIGMITRPETLQAQGITAAGLTKTFMASGGDSSSGTRLYMAPELLEGKPPTTLSDIYALGVVLYQMVIAGFDHAVAPGWERDVEDEFLREDIGLCVDGKPERRLQSANEIAERLRTLEMRREEAQARRRLLAEAEEARRAARQSRRRRKQALAVLGLGVTAILAITGFAIREYRRAEEQEALHRQASAAQGAAEHGRYLADIQLAAIRVEQSCRLTARKALLDAPAQLRNWEWGYLADQAWSARPEPSPEAFADGRPGTLMSETWADSEGYVTCEFGGHGAFVSGIAFDHGGMEPLHRIATSSGDGAARLWDMRDGSLLSTFPADAGPLYAVAFNASGTCVGTAGWTGLVRIWDVSAGKPLLTLRPEGGSPARRIDLKCPGSRILTIHYDKTACIWDASDGRLLARCTGSEGEILMGRLSEDTARLVTSGTDGKVRSWDARTGQLLDSMSGPCAGSQIIDPSLKNVVSLQTDRVVLWDFASGKLLHTFDVKPLDVATASFSKDGSCVLVACQDRVTRLWNTATGQLLAVLENTTGGTFFCAACSDDGARIAIGSEDGTVTLWRPVRRGVIGHEGRVMHGHDGFPSHAWFSPDGKRIVTSAYDGIVKVWDAETLGMVSVFRGHSSPILHSVFSRDGKRVHSLSMDGLLKVWESETGHELWSATANPEALRHSIERVGGMHSNLILDSGALIRGDCESPDGRCSLIFTDDEAFVADALSGRKIVALEDCHGGTDAISFSPDGARVTISGHGRTDTGVWETVSGRRLCSLAGHLADVTAAKFSPDGRSVLTASPDGTARIWEASTGREQRLLACGAGLFTARFSPDGKHVITASLDCTATLFDVATGEREAVLVGHSAFVLDASFSPDNRRILTLSSDHTVKVWDLLGHDLLTLSPGKRIATAEWSPDGHAILTAHTDGTARLWEAAPWENLGSSVDSSKSFEDRLEHWRTSGLQHASAPLAQ